MGVTDSGYEPNFAIAEARLNFCEIIPLFSDAIFCPGTLIEL